MRRLVLLASAAALLAPVGAHAAASDLTETRRTTLPSRLLELGFTTPALPGETNVRILLPDGYDAHPRRRYPTLYLLHGCCDTDVDGSRAWTTHGRVEELTAGRPLIVVMPAGGKGGMYSDWVEPGLQGRPRWETYHLEQLVPWVDAHLRTIAGREGRAIAGLSMGGFGAMKYAATHPDRFVAASSFSGIVDSNVNGGLVHGALPALDGGTPASVWGLRASDELRWRSQNPWDLAENLAPLRLAVVTGDGRPGPLDAGGGLPFDPVEQQAEQNSVSLHRRLDALHIDHTWHDYGPGTHTWPYWTRDLQQALPGLMALFADPPGPPSAVTYRSALPAYEVFGWRVTFPGRDGLAWSRLVGASADGFVLEGTGRAEVRLPASIDPATTVTVDGAPVVATVEAGRLVVPVVLRDGAGRATVRLHAPAARGSCASRRVITVTVPRELRGARASLAGRRVPVRGRRVRVDLRGRSAGAFTLVIRGRDAHGRAVRVVRRFRTCA